MDLNRINNFFLKEKNGEFFKKREERGKAVGNRLQTLEGTRERDGLRGAPEGASAQHGWPPALRARVQGAETCLQVPGRPAVWGPTPHDDTR